MNNFIDSIKQIEKAANEANGLPGDPDYVEPELLYGPNITGADINFKYCPLCGCKF